MLIITVAEDDHRDDIEVRDDLVNFLNDNLSVLGFKSLEG